MEALCEGTRDAGAIKQVRDAGNAAADASRKLCDFLLADLHDLRITQTGLTTFNSIDMYTGHARQGLPAFINEVSCTTALTHASGCWQKNSRRSRAAWQSSDEDVKLLHESGESTLQLPLYPAVSMFKKPREGLLHTFCFRLAGKGRGRGCRLGGVGQEAPCINKAELICWEVQGIP